VLAVALVCGTAQGQASPSAAQALAAGPYAHMEMTQRRSFLRVAVVSVDVWLDEMTRGRVRELARGRSYSRELGSQIAATVLDSQDALVRVRFLRRVTLDQFLDAVAGSLERAQRAGVLDERERREAHARAAEAFGVLGSRGFARGDRIEYRLRPALLRTMVVASTGDVLLDRTASDGAARRAILAGYFARGSDYREPLVRSLFR
jgi:hypothetical protein